MAFDFPTSPTLGQKYPEPAVGGLPVYTWDGEKWAVGGGVGAVLSIVRNRLVNPAMQHSQEQGNASTGVGSVSSAWYSADQWAAFWTISPGTASMQRVQVTTPNGSKDRLRVVVGTAKAVLAAGDNNLLLQRIEASRTADFRWGTASARQVILRFGWKGPAGTYSVAISNGLINRSYVVNFTISAGQANADTEQTLIIPGDTTGTWATDSTTGPVVQFVMAAGTTYQGVAGWQAGNMIVTSTNTNGMATAGNTFELFDVGLYLDVGNTGVAPKWELPDEPQEFLACQRYYYISNAGNTPFQGNTGNSTSAVGYGKFPVRMRVVPTMTVLNGTAYIWNTNQQTTGAAVTCSAASADHMHSLAKSDNWPNAGYIYGVMYTANARM